MNHKFFLNCIGIAAIVFASAFLVRSIQPANAAPKPTDFFSEETGSSGRFHVQFCPGVDGNGSFYFEAMISDTQTGKSSVYKWNRDTQVWEDFFTGKDAIPSEIK